MTHIPPALIAKAKTAQSAEQLLELAKENNVQMTEAEAKAYFEQIRTQGAVADDDLEIVAGGACGDSESSYSAGDKVRMTDGSRCPQCKKTEGVIEFFVGVTRPSAVNGTGSGLCVKCRECPKIICDSIDRGNFIKCE